MTRKKAGVQSMVGMQMAEACGFFFHVWVTYVAIASLHHFWFQIASPSGTSSFEGDFKVLTDPLELFSLRLGEVRT